MSNLSPLPVSYVLLFLDILRERGIDTEPLMPQFGLSPEVLNNPEQLIPGHIIERAILLSYELAEDEGLGLEYGLRSGPLLHGMLGFALTSAGSVRELAELTVRFVSLRQQNFSLEIQLDNETGILLATDVSNMGSIRRFIYESSLVGYAHALELLLADKNVPVEIWFDWPEPDYQAAYADRLPAIRYGMDSIQIRYPLEMVDKKPYMANPLASKETVAELERISSQQRKGGDCDSFIEQVTRFIQLSDEGYPNLSATASHFNISASTLKRRLRDASISYKDILDAARKSDAKRLLANPELNISQISRLLGYSDPPSFTRAFQQWFGKTPSEFREEL